MADAAARRLDDHGLARLHLTAVDDHVPRGREDDLPGRGGLVGEAVGQEVRGACRRDHVLGIPAQVLHAEHLRVGAQIRLAGAAVAALPAFDLVLGPHAVAGLQVLDAGTDRVDLAGELDAEAARIILQQYFDQFPL